MQYKVREIKKDRINIKYLLPLFIIIPFLGFFLYFVVTSPSPIFLLRSFFFDYTPKVKYETFKIYINKDIPKSINEKVVAGVSDIQFENIHRFEFVEKEDADYILAASESERNVILSKELIPVGHTYWISDSLTTESLRGKKVIMEAAENTFMGEYLKDLLSVKITVVDSVIDELKKGEEIVGFVFPSKLTKEMKILKLDDKNPLIDIDGSFKYSYTLQGDEDVEFVYSILEKNVDDLESDTLDRDNIVKINMTGVTAISRGLASKIDTSRNWAYPARDLGEFLSDADLTHTSNEVSFKAGCNVYTGMRFCAKPEYIETMKESGIDIVELTGNHNNDFGADNNAKSIQMYEELGWDYFGGGLNTQDSEKILYKEVKGSRIAFMGYNYYDTMLNTLALAGENRAGSNSYSVSKLEDNIKEAKENADVVIVTFQFQECYSYPPSDVIYPICYKPLSSPDQKGVFRQAIDFGADIVVGTQAHQPQTYESYNGGMIFYGLGNLYFDQSRWIGTRQGLVLSLYILEDKVVQAQLTPTIYDTNLIPRVADEKTGDLLLELLKSARNF